MQLRVGHAEEDEGIVVHSTTGRSSWSLWLTPADAKTLAARLVEMAEDYDGKEDSDEEARAD